MEQVLSGFEPSDFELMASLGELLDAVDAGLLSMERERYARTQASARALITQHLFDEAIDAHCERSWALRDLYEEALTAQERTAAKVVYAQFGSRL